MKKVKTIALSELSEMAQNMYGNLVKVVVDVKKKRMVVDAPMRVDQEQFLLESSSAQADLWGINLHHTKFGTEDFVEFDSMINIRPRANNMPRSVEDEAIRQQARELISEIVHE